MIYNLYFSCLLEIATKPTTDSHFQFHAELLGSELQFVLELCGIVFGRTARHSHVFVFIVTFQNSIFFRLLFHHLNYTSVHYIKSGYNLNSM